MCNLYYYRSKKWLYKNYFHDDKKTFLHSTIYLDFHYVLICNFSIFIISSIVIYSYLFRLFLLLGKNYFLDIFFNFSSIESISIWVLIIFIHYLCLFQPIRLLCIFNIKDAYKQYKDFLKVHNIIKPKRKDFK
jgi:hypothetical protein